MNKQARKIVEIALVVSTGKVLFSVAPNTINITNSAIIRSATILVKALAPDKPGFRVMKKTCMPSPISPPGRKVFNPCAINRTLIKVATVWGNPLDLASVAHRKPLRNKVAEARPKAAKNTFGDVAKIASSNCAGSTKKYSNAPKEAAMIHLAFF